MNQILFRALAKTQAHERADTGQTVVEYALVVGLVSIIIVATLATAGSDWISKLTSKVTAAIG